MTQLSRERLEEIRDYDTCVTLEESAEMARRLLAVEGQVPVAYMIGGHYLMHAQDPKVDNYASAVPLYAAPQPAPVAQPVQVPDEDFERALSVLNDTLDDCGDSERGLLLVLDRMGIEVRSNACRAGMLQPSSGALQWIPCSERMPEESGRYWCYVEEQNSLGKSHYQWNCSWNGDVWSDKALTGRVTHWMPLPAAPKEPTK